MFYVFARATFNNLTAPVQLATRLRRSLLCVAAGAKARRSLAVPGRDR
jgi:hypothetical protein